jgi:hypothetical protein
LSLSLGVWLYLVVWPGCAAGEAGGDVEGDQAFAESRIANEDRDTSQRNAAGPKPFQAGFGNVGQEHSAIALDGFLGGAWLPGVVREAVAGRIFRLLGRIWVCVHVFSIPLG